LNCLISLTFWSISLAQYISAGYWIFPYGEQNEDIAGVTRLRNRNERVK